MSTQIHLVKLYRTTLLSCALLILSFIAGLSPAAAADSLMAGSGQFVYTGYKPLANKPVTVHYHIPKDLPADAPIMILMHGNSRAATSYRNSMAKLAARDKFLLFVPEFSKEFFPGSRDYHQGGVFGKDRKMKKKEEWTFSIIEPLFDHIKQITGKENEGYILYGFSAGSQFAHRYTWFFPENRAIKTIAASAGSYTMPDYSTPYLYGLKNTRIPEANLVKAFAKDFTVAVGTADTVLSRDDLPKSAAVVKQGRDRVERARNFFDASKRLAEKMGVPFNWKFELIADAGHSQSEMAAPIADLLQGNKSVSQKLEAIMKRNAIPGMQIVHVKAGKTEAFAFGEMKAGSGREVTANTLFQSASLSKTVMAYAVLRLYDKGILSLDKPLESYLPNPRLSDEPRRDLITARMVLSHTTGFPNWTKPRGAQLKTSSKPGSKFTYSGEGFLMLQKVVEHLTKKTLQQIAEEEVFKPLAMRQSGYIYRASMVKDYANGHNGIESIGLRKMSEPNGAYSLITSASDYSAFVQKALLKGEGLKPATHAMMLETAVERKKNLGVALGVMVQTNEKGRGIYHTGSNPGFRAFYFALPDSGESVVCFTNSTNGAKVRKEIATLFFGPQSFPAF